MGKTNLQCSHKNGSLKKRNGKNFVEMKGSRPVVSRWGWFRWLVFHGQSVSIDAGEEESYTAAVVVMPGKGGGLFAAESTRQRLAWDVS